MKSFESQLKTIFMKKIVLLCCLFYFGVKANTQSVMLIPFGEDKQLIIKDDPCYRLIQTKIQKLFLQEANYALIDYWRVLQNIGDIDLRRNSTKADLITILVQSASPDIYIVADIKNDTKIATQGKREHALTINLTAHWTHDGKFLGGDVLFSGWRFYGYSDDCYFIIEKAFQNKNDEGHKKSIVFAKEVVNRFPSEKPSKESEEFPSHYHSIKIEFFLDQNATYHYFSKMSTEEILVKTITKWIKNKTVDKQASSNSVKEYLIYHEIHIPMNNPETQEPYSPSEFAQDLYIFLSELSPKDNPESLLEFNPESKGNHLVFTLQ